MADPKPTGAEAMSAEQIVEWFRGKYAPRGMTITYDEGADLRRAIDAHAAAAVAREREKWQAAMWDCYMRLPVVPGDAIAWIDSNLEQHVIRVADEYAILQRQREAAEAALAEAAKERDECLALTVKFSRKVIDVAQERDAALADVTRLTRERDLWVQVFERAVDAAAGNQETLDKLRAIHAYIASDAALADDALLGARKAGGDG